MIDRLQSRRLATSVESDVFLARVHPGWHYVLIVVAVVIGLSLVPVVQPDDLGFLGLLSALPLPVVLAMQALVVGFVIALRHAPTERILGSYTVALVTLLRGIPALAYEFPRLPWAWKHVGIVDYIQRHLSVDATVTDIEMRAYHNWPGFFGFNTVVTDAGGLSSVMSLVPWAPLIFGLLFLIGMYPIARSFSDDSRFVWLTLFIFTVGNWVGQDYFAPQAVAYFLWLIFVALLLRHVRTGADQALHLSKSTVPVPVVNAALLILMAAMVVVHQLTPVMAILSLVAVRMVRRIRVRWMIASIVGMMAVWLATHAWPFASVYIPKVIAETLAAPTRIEDGLIDLARASAAQTAIAQTSRVLTAAVGGLALMGTIRVLRTRAIDWKTALALAAIPLVLVVSISYGNEVLFRAFFFGLPFLSLLAAALWYGRAPTPRREAVVQGTLTAILGGMLILSFISTYGNDAATTFTAKEVAAANEMYDEASPHSLVWILAPDTPRKFKNYENFDERRLNIYPAEALQRLIQDVPRRLDEWSERLYTDVFVFVTRSQLTSIERRGTYGGGDYVEDFLSQLANSDAELVISNEDVLLYRLRGDS